MNIAEHFIADRRVTFEVYAANASVLQESATATTATVLEWNEAALGPQPTDEELAAVLAMPDPPPPPQTVFSSRELMQTLFSPAEQTALATAAQSNAQMLLFMLFIAATPMVDITNPEFIADINAVKAAGLLTADRAAQVLAGTPAPTA